ncbi:MFS general substrate transporter [Aspergillus stella-maris]|uniref:MFS general substrate transporter n=1 Tax=Aspergillus stella-maris TaxID=1810926 RepID=UPI003CCDF790
MNVTTLRDEPPGTVTIEDVGHGQSAAVIVLEPRPTDDPNDPLNWSKPRKTVNFVIASFYTLATFVLLDIGTVVWVNMNSELSVSWANLNNSFAANLAGLAVGCIFFIPFAIKYGRRSVYIVSTAVQFASGIWNARVNSTGELLAVNVLSGLAGAVSEAIVQMTIVDLFFVHQRASANAVYNVMVNAGAYLAPVAAGYCASAQGWRWIWWWTAIMLGINLILFLFFYEESKYIPTLIAQEGEDTQVLATIASKTVKKSDIEGEYMRTDPDSSASYRKKSYRERMAFITKTDNSLLDNIKRPLVVLVSFPAVTFTAFVWGCFLSWFSILSTTQSSYLSYPPYNYTSSQIGLFSLPPFIGGLFGAALGGPINDWYILWRAKRNNGIFEPETRLHLGLPAILATPLGILIFGLGLSWGWPWWSLALGSGIFGFAFSSVGAVALTYLADCYQDIVGDALVGVAFVRNGLSTIFVFAVTPWIEASGLRDMFIAVACISTGTLLILIPMIMYGKKMRVWTAKRYREMARLQPGARKI